MSQESTANRSSNQLHNLTVSVLDLAPVVSGSTTANAFRNSLELAQRAEQWGYNRYWLAEHHNMPGIASSATSILIGHIAAGTSTIRVGSGGIMLPNHAPLVIAEQFGTLETLFPGRIDLGLGRAPGSDQRTMMALRRDARSGHDFPEQLNELRSYLKPSGPAPVRAFPGEGLDIPIWLLGSSGFSAELAGKLGLPFAFASHFSPEYMLPALDLYRSSFQPSEVLDAPYAMVAVNIIAADTDAQARRTATSMYQTFLDMIRGRTPGQLKPPVDSMDGLWDAYEKAAVERQLGSSIIGSPETVKEKLHTFLKVTQADEIMVAAHIYDHQERLHSYEIVSQLINSK
ncbi:LLM class flavin-dependent oxidoreductase [Paenibacillus rigui]|uniref:LLM class flavin-dependent oxidoreductase n=1 Tax=Paenibacillus rigui TaxID=554312 RepID=A0A229UJ18_9BACL|nr:LLM class flavin-dependent oxidoreductase [Paenibacillus rigui]OXM83372.1 LLM class flavin-dependent oxidoreductase [Paenibacillus rigui]